MDAFEVQAPGRRRGSGIRPQPPVEQPREAVRRNLQHGPDQRSDHVAQEAAGADLELDGVLAVDPAGLEDIASEDLVIAVGGGEGAEVVLADDQRGGGVEGRSIEGTGIPPRPARLERGSCPSLEDAVPVAARPGRMARVEVGRRLLCSDDGDVVRQRRVERVRDPLRGRPALDLNARHLAEGVHTRVRTAGYGEPFPGRNDLVERGAQRTFDRPQPGLRRPAVEIRAVVLECELEARRYCTGAGAASSTGSCTVRTTGAGGT
jgi:hypothetical protein